MEAINYQINEEDNMLYGSNGSTLTPDLIEIEDNAEDGDRYTDVPPRTSKHTVLISCNSRNDRPDKDRTCEARQFLWRGSTTVEVSDYYYPDAIVYEGYDDQWFTNASENIASLEDYGQN